MNFFHLSFAAIVLMLCASCATQSKTIPTAADLDRNQQRFRALAQPEFDDLERRKADGTLNQADYERQKANLEFQVQQRAVDAAWTAHSLAESDRKATGIPTPDQPQSISTTNPGGSLYQSYGSQYGSQAGYGAAGSMSSGQLGGGSFLGR